MEKIKKLGPMKLATLILSVVTLVLVATSFLTEAGQLAKFFLSNDLFSSYSAASMSFSERFQLAVSKSSSQWTPIVFCFYCPSFLPVLNLFRPIGNTKILKISGAIQVVLTAYFYIAGREVLHAKAIVLLVVSILLFVTTWMDRSKTSEHQISKKSCPKCGEQNNIHAVYCSNCGTSI